jgi:hypothetical protein
VRRVLVEAGKASLLCCLVADAPALGAANRAGYQFLFALDWIVMGSHETFQLLCKNPMLRRFTGIEPVPEILNAARGI